MRILLLSHVPDNPDGGASRVYHLIADGLRARGHDVRLYHLDDMSLPRWRPAAHAARRLTLPDIVSRFGAKTKSQQPDVIMASNGTGGSLFAALRRGRSPTLLVNHIHGLSVFDHRAALDQHRAGSGRVSFAARWLTGPLQARWDREGVQSADLTIVQNRRDADVVAPAPHILIAPAVHPDILTQSADIPPPISRPPIILWFASWLARKGCHSVPAAFREIRARHPEARLILGGTGLPANFLLPLFDADDRAAVSVLPRITLAEQADWFRKAAVMVFPSLSEGFGLALAEAMCFGVAAVAGRTGFAADRLTDQVDARLIDGSAASLADAVIDLLDDQETRNRIALAGRTVARSLTVAQMAQAYEAAFLGAIARRELHDLAPSRGTGRSSEKTPMPDCEVAVRG